MNLGWEPDRAISLRWLIIAAWAGVSFTAILKPTLIAADLLRYLTLALMVLFALLHGARRYGWGGISAYFVMAIVIANLFENMSISSGFPFGNYQHTAAMGPKFLHVPLIVGPIFAAVGYLGWVLAGILLGDTQSERHPGVLLAQPIVAAFVTTSWDLCVDPIGGTLNRDWIWADGGGYFGVPWLNYFGWMLTTWIIFQLFSIYLAAWGKPGRAPRSRAYWMQPVVFWTVIALQFPLLSAIVPGAALSDPAGGVWRAADLLDTTALAAVFTMLFVAFLSMVLVHQPRR
jgi:uncharacterized membrane protein